MEQYLKQALNELAFVKDREVKTKASFSYVNLIKDLKLGIYKEGKDFFVFLGESLRDFFRIKVYEPTVDAIIIAIRALKKSEQYKYAIMRQRFI